MERKVKQTRLEDFITKNVEEQNREAISNIRRNHTVKMAELFDQIFQRLFNEPYTRSL
jgi:hypothetical protein